MDKLLITGAAGLLGRQILMHATSNYECIGVDINSSDISCDFHILNISDREKTLALIEKTQPDYVIHTAAITNVDYCEQYPDEAKIVNVDGVKNLAFGCKKVDAKMAYVSTDFVFDGIKGGYSEDDPVNPLGYYAKTKLWGEQALTEVGIDYSIGRTSVLYGWHPSNFNFVMWIIDTLKKDEQITIVTDQYNSPTLADNLAEMLLAMRDKSGVYHTSGSERISRFDFALKVADVFELDKSLIMPITHDSLHLKSPRPMDSSLDTSKAANDLRVKILNITEGLIRMKESQK